MTYQEFCTRRNEAWKYYLMVTEGTRQLWITKQISTKACEDACRVYLNEFSNKVEQLVKRITSWGAV